jgi:hypothetical protein
MNIAQHQRDLFRLVTLGDDRIGADDPYIKAVAQSPQLEMLREVILSWREFDVERSCVLTSALLRRLGIFKELVREFASRGPISPFVEKLGEAFLEGVSAYGNPVVASMARFELAILKVKHGDSSEYSVDWPCDPRPVLNGEAAGENGGPLGYRTVISVRIPGLVQLIEIE